MKIKELINNLKKNPKKVFLMDAWGAIISLFSFWSILYPLEIYFGVPKTVLLKLSIIAICLFIYSFASFKLIKQNHKPFLKIIILLNSLYILFSIGLIFYYFKQLSFLGISYFVIEIAVILGVLFVEVKVYKYKL